MAKRLISGDIWTQNKWFRKLEPELKCMWFYLMLNCDNVGVWEEDCELSSYIIRGQAITKEKLLATFKDQIKPFNGKKLWLIDFCDFQWGPLNEDDIGNKPHQSYIRLLKHHGLWTEYKKRLSPKKTKKDGEPAKQDKLQESFDIFWNHYHKITRKNKEDKEPAFGHWKKLTYEEQLKAYKSVVPYAKTQDDATYLKKARTYLNDKTFNNEFTPVNASGDSVLKGNFHKKETPHA